MCIYRKMNPDQTHTINQVGGSTASEPAPKPPGGGSGVTQYNMRCPAVKRLMREAMELSTPEYDFSAQPTETNLFEWHFTIRGPEECEFEDGVYHGRILFPSDYPMKPPSFVLLTPNGRFQTDEKICLSISNYHPETWLPSWSIRTALVALRSFMTTPGNEGAIGSINFSPEERKKLAIKSQTWTCHECGPIIKLLPAKVETTCNSKGSGDTSDLQNPVSNLLSTLEEVKSSVEETPVAQCNSSCTKDSSNQETVTTTTSSASTPETGEASALTEDQPSQRHRQQNEPVKNILYDFGIGCFVVLILALCLRRLLVLFLRL